MTHGARSLTPPLPRSGPSELDEAAKRGSVNFYMFEGGTNFGFMSGRNGGSKTGDVTSYDYDAPLTEDGPDYPKNTVFLKRLSQNIPIYMKSRSQLKSGVGLTAEFPARERRTCFPCLTK